MQRPPDLDDSGKPINIIPPPVMSGRPPDLDDNGEEFAAPLISRPQPKPQVDEYAGYEQKGLTELVPRFLKNHPKIREAGQRALTGTSPEFEEKLKQKGVSQFVGPITDESLLPEWKYQPELGLSDLITGNKPEESWPSFLARGAYNNIIRPLGSPEGFAGAGDPYGFAIGKKAAGVVDNIPIRKPRFIDPSTPSEAEYAAGIEEVRNSIKTREAKSLEGRKPYSIEEDLTQIKSNITDKSPIHDRQSIKDLANPHSQKMIQALHDDSKAKLLSIGDDPASLSKSAGTLNRRVDSIAVRAERPPDIPASVETPIVSKNSDAFNRFKGDRLEQELDATAKLRGTPEDIPDNPIARQIEEARRETPIEASVNKEEAKFIGWQEDGSGGAIPLYNVGRDTVSTNDLIKRGINIPEHAPFKTPENAKPGRMVNPFEKKVDDTALAVKDKVHVGEVLEAEDAPLSRPKITPEQIAANNELPYSQWVKLSPEEKGMVWSEKHNEYLNPSSAAFVKDTQRMIDERALRNKDPNYVAEQKAKKDAWDQIQDNIRASSEDKTPGIIEMQGGLGIVAPPKSRPGSKARAQDKLLDGLASIKGRVKIQESVNKRAKAQKFAAFDSVGGKGEEWFNKASSKMKGEHDKVQLPEGMQLSENEVDSLFTSVKTARITTPEKLRAGMALKKILNGERLPVRSELAVLDTVFGDGFAGKIIEMQGGLGSVGISLTKVANTMKAMKSSLDVSGPLRQGLGLIHRPEWREAAKEMFKFWGNKKYFDESMAAIHADPEYLPLREGGLFIAEPKNLLHSEEAFMDNYVPQVLMEGYTGVIGASERAYVGFLNQLRFNTAKNMIRNAKDGGVKVFDEVIDEAGKKTSIPTKELTDIIKVINNGTGRGSLGRFQKIAPELNAAIWSPALLSSRLTVLNPHYYVKLSPFARKEALKNLLSIAAFGTTVIGLGAVAGGKVSGNPLNSDFLKIRHGNRVIDPWGGYQQPIVAGMRFLATVANKGRTSSNQFGKGTSTPTGSMAPLTTVGRFAASKESPAAALAHDLLTGNKFTGASKPGSLSPLSLPETGGYTNRFGEKTHVSAEIRRSFQPMITETLEELIKSDPEWAESVGLTAASALGVGIQNYPESKPAKTPQQRGGFRGFKGF